MSAAASTDLRGQTSAEAQELVKQQRLAKKAAKEAKKLTARDKLHVGVADASAAAAAATPSSSSSAMATPTPESPAAAAIPMPKLDRVPVYVPRADLLLACAPRAFLAADADGVDGDSSPSAAAVGSADAVVETLQKLTAKINATHNAAVKAGDDHDDDGDGGSGDERQSPKAAPADILAAAPQAFAKVAPDNTFAPNVGICCVSHFVPSMQQGFCRKLYEALEAHPAIKDTLILLHWSQYRVTLTALEFTGARSGILNTPDATEGPRHAAKVFRECQQLIDSELGALAGPSAKYLKFVASVPYPELIPAARDYKSALGVKLEACAGFENKLRAVGVRVQDLCRRRAPTQRQFALGVGYFKLGLTPAQRLGARLALYECLLGVLGESFDLASLTPPLPTSMPPAAAGKAPPPIRFEVALAHPQICLHESMAAMHPLFPRSTPVGGSGSFSASLPKPTSQLRQRGGESKTVPAGKVPPGPARNGAEEGSPWLFVVSGYVVPLLVVLIPAWFVFSIFSSSSD